jgi:hypothetical protein
MRLDGPVTADVIVPCHTPGVVFVAPPLPPVIPVEWLDGELGLLPPPPHAAMRNAAVMHEAVAFAFM